MDKFSSHDDQDELFDKEFIPLDQARAEQMFTPQSLRQQVKSPWEIVQLQVITTFWFTIFAVIWSFIETNNGLVVSILCGGLVGILPTIAFIMRLGIYTRNSKNNASQFVGRLIKAEVIKISITLILIVLVVAMYDDLEWLPFLAMYIITLQSYWIIGLKKKN
jgi:F0F1-type ATP synthase assembly protein I